MLADVVEHIRHAVVGVARRARGVTVRLLPERRSAALRSSTPDVVERSYVEPGSGRTFRVLTRHDHDARVPAAVLVALHAYATPPDLIPASFELVPRAVRARGFVLVVPQGLRDSHGKLFWNATLGCRGAGSPAPDDLGYLRAVLREVQALYTVDPARVYALGVSNGAFMAHRWAASGGELRAIACIAGVGPGERDAPFAPTLPVRVLQIHGRKDTVIRYQGGHGLTGDAYPSVAATVAAWCRHDGTAAVPHMQKRWSLHDGRIRCERFVGPRADVVLWTALDAGHEIRSARHAVEEILDFFDGVAASRHLRPL